MSSEIDDKQLIKQYLQGDEKSLEFLIARYLKPIYNFIYKSINYQEIAEDITQDVFIKVWKNLKKFDQNKNFKPWIFQIAKNTTIDYLRKKKTIPFSRFENDNGQNLFLENLKEESPDLVESFANKAELDKILNSLNKEEQEIIDMRHKQGMSFRQIADFLQKPINTIKSRYRRIMNQKIKINRIIK